MDDKKRAAQGAVPNQAAAEAQQTLYEKKDYSGGNAMLDAQIQAGEMQGDDPVVEDAIATDIAGNTETDVPNEAKNFTTTGDYPVDQNRLQKDYTPPAMTQEQDSPDPGMSPEQPMR